MSSFANEQKTSNAQISVGELAALAGTTGTPGAGNKYVTDSDSRLSANPNPLRYISVSLTAAEIKALRATAKTILGAPGTSKYIQVLSVVLQLTAVTTPFTGIGTLQLKYDTSAGVSALDTAIPAGAITAAASQTTSATGSNQSNLSSVAVNKALVLHNIGAAEFLAGDGTAKLKLLYYVHDLS